MSVRPKTVDFEGMLQDIGANLGIRTQSVSDKLGISQLSIVCHIHNIS